MKMIKFGIFVMSAQSLIILKIILNQKRRSNQKRVHHLLGQMKNMSELLIWLGEIKTPVSKISSQGRLASNSEMEAVLV